MSHLMNVAGARRSMAATIGRHCRSGLWNVFSDATWRFALSGDQTFRLSSSLLLAMKMDHFPATDDPCIRNGRKAGARSERTMDAKTDESAGKCPVMHTTRTNRDWWPNQLNIQVLHQ